MGNEICADSIPDAHMHAELFFAWSGRAEPQAPHALGSSARSTSRRGRLSPAPSCCAVACVMLAACQSGPEVRQKPLSNPDAPMGRVDLNPPFGLGIHPAAEKLATGKNQWVLLAAFADR